MPMTSVEDRRQYQRLWTAGRRASFFGGKTCVSCGSAEDLELDHIDRRLKASHRIWSWSNERRQAELAKCQVLCGTCHKRKTKIDLFTPIQHGTRKGYDRGCGCIDCKGANALRSRERRLQLKNKQATVE